AAVVGFYLFGQGGLEHWETPIIYPFVTWSYFYPTGLLTAGIAHGSPGHIVGNMTGTLAFAPIVEYAWGHYPPSARNRDRLGGPTAGSGVLGRPAVRALVVFPAVLLIAAFVTSAFAAGPGLGFSGAVFAIAGFAVITYPMTTVVAVVAASAVGTVYTALTEPIVRATLESGGPSLPAWTGIAFQAHLLGFLLGVVAGSLLLRRRGRRPALDRVFFGTFLLGTVQALWLPPAPAAGRSRDRCRPCRGPRAGAGSGSSGSSSSPAACSAAAPGRPSRANSTESVSPASSSPGCCCRYRHCRRYCRTPSPPRRSPAAGPPPRPSPSRPYSSRRRRYRSASSSSTGPASPARSPSRSATTGSPTARTSPSDRTD
ncbi:hypothetical protein BRD14_03240, partial [Halobacteriales archaeon SW_5_68_122]